MVPNSPLSKEELLEVEAKEILSRLIKIPEGYLSNDANKFVEIIVKLIMLKVEDKIYNEMNPMFKGE